jgi:SAM-dependent methyltransferase
MDAGISSAYYSQPHWDEQAWIGIIGVEYEQILASAPIARKLEQQSHGKPLLALDVGCGTAIFPSMLDRQLTGPLLLICDLLDRSELSLARAADRLASLRHFQARRQHHAAIETIPSLLPLGPEPYDVIWAIHSFTTVDVRRMPAVLSHLLRLLAENGRIYIVQLEANSAYQTIHQYYRDRLPNGGDHPAFMTAEQTLEILARQAVDVERVQVRVDHRVDARRQDLLNQYLQKCVLDPQLDALPFFQPLLDAHHRPTAGEFRFRQFVSILSLAPVR